MIFFPLKSISAFLISILILLCLCNSSIAEQNGNVDNERSVVQSNIVNQNQNSLHVSAEHATDRLIVRYNPDKVKTKSELMSVQSMANAEAGSNVILDTGKNGIPGMQVVQVTSTTLESAMESYQANPDVLYVEPDYKISLSPGEETRTAPVMASMQAASTTYPNDPQYPSLWGLHNTGQAPFYGTNNADIQGPLAWGATTGSPGVVVAVVDTGVDYSHPDLASNIWTNPGEIPGNGIDDDGNGYIDDTKGWNFIDKNNNPMDDNGHGTHCAGTIAAVGNNGIGIAGVTWKCKIMPLKFLNSQGNGYISDAISAILYANQKGVPIISLSWGGLESQSLRDAIDASSAVVVCAAGNTGANADSNPIYPAAYTSSNVISVAATDYHDKLASFSNYGIQSVDLAAPGVSIYSTAPSGGYKFMNGTSMATPYVSGVAALIKSQNPSMTAAQIKSRILSNCDILSSLSGKVATGGRLNAAKALGISNPTPTSTPTPYPTPTITRTPTQTQTPYPTPTVTRTPTQTPTPYPTPTITRTPTQTQTPYPTPTVTRTPTQTPTPYPTPTITRTPTQTQTPYPTPTVTRTPTQTPTPYPTPTITSAPTYTQTPYPTNQPSNNCGIYKTDTKTGFLRQGQAMVLGYYIPAEGRSRIEWKMSSFGSPNTGKGPNKNDKYDKKSGYSFVSKDSTVFDLYICKDCNPKYSYCMANKYAYGPNSYVSITPPASGSTYYALVYARSGSGTFNMQANSYRCPGNSPGIIASMQSFPDSNRAGDSGTGTDVPIPKAEIVPY
ncbi:S8 family peptidase [uncultured Methanospirillum sp.]|uniref:S8 family peptidase n=1 Tax=uncultured Methanospirillum sp. TaxID=262503 RepID=UPI0029C7062F|nr:S8 family peptidase [uncultured Methanospirillum sp.]